MKRYLVWVLATVALAIAAPSAFATRVIFDPPAPAPTGVTTGDGGTDCTVGNTSLNDYTPCNISQFNTPYSVKFVDCTTLTGLQNPASGWCLYMINASPNAFSQFTFAFDVPEGGSYDGSDMLSCGSQPAGFATNNCPPNTTLTSGQELDLTFFAALPGNTAFYLITDFLNSPGYANVTVAGPQSAPHGVPEPDELGLFGLGLLALGVGVGLQRRRQKPWINDTV